MKGIDCDVISANSKEAVEPNDNTNAHETLRTSRSLALSLSPSLALSSLSMNKYWIFVNTQILCWWNKWWENGKSFTAAMTSWIYDGKKNYSSTQSNSLNHNVHLEVVFALRLTSTNFFSLPNVKRSLCTNKPTYWCRAAPINAPHPFVFIICRALLLIDSPKCVDIKLKHSQAELNLGAVRSTLHPIHSRHGTCTNVNQ